MATKKTRFEYAHALWSVTSGLDEDELLSILQKASEDMNDEQVKKLSRYVVKTFG